MCECAVFVVVLCGGRRELGRVGNLENNLMIEVLMIIWIELVAPIFQCKITTNSD